MRPVRRQYRIFHSPAYLNAYDGYKGVPLTAGSRFDKLTSS